LDSTKVARIIAKSQLRELPSAELEIAGDSPVFTNAYEADGVAAVAVALTGRAAADLWALRSGYSQAVSVDVSTAAAMTASLTFDRINSQSVVQARSPVTDFYRCRAGDWIHLHGGLPHLAEGTLGLLQCEDSRESIQAAVRGWDSGELEEELAARGLCGARARSAEEWKSHSQGELVSGMPAVEILKLGPGDPVPFTPSQRPLSGVRVLEFARILAAPICGRTLAEHGAEVLNVSSKGLPGLFNCEVNTGHGKRSCFLDLNIADEADRARHLALAGDVFVNGFRSGSLEARGLGPYELAAARPGIIYVSINCYGHDGPWVGRRGWEQQAQSTSGLALGQGAGARPFKMPAVDSSYGGRTTAPNDYVTGCLAAYGAVIALHRRAVEGGSWWVRASLCQTAAWIERCGLRYTPSDALGLGDTSRLETRTATPFGDLIHLRPAVQMSATPPRWESPPPVQGSATPAWS
jgi:hypothetical protein